MHRAYTRHHIYPVSTTSSKNPASDEAPTAAAMSDVVDKAFNITELMTLFVENVSTRDLIRARRVCKTFDRVIMDNRTSSSAKLKLFCTPSTKPMLDHICWVNKPELTRSWQPYIRTTLDAQSDDRACPIFDLNPALTQYEDRTGQELSLSHGWDKAIINFDANAFSSTLKDDSPWVDMLLTQPRRTEVTLTFFCDRDQWVQEQQEECFHPMVLHPGLLMRL